jgi:ABC-type multidrug transport system ATPase subunit
MRIKATDLGKKFKGQIVVKDVNIDWDTNGVYAILGGNGSGKSTTLRMLAGMLSPSRGAVEYYDGESLVPIDRIFSYVSFAGPYHEIIEEMKLLEFLSFTKHFKPFYQNRSPEEIAEKMELSQHANKPISAFSSGMKQRVKLAIALLSQTPFVFLDEPVSHLDAKSIAWYKSLVAEVCTEKIIIVASNHNVDEYPGVRVELSVG